MVDSRLSDCGCADFGSLRPIGYDTTNNHTAYN